MAPPLSPATELNSGQRVAKILEIMNLTSCLSLESATNLNDFRGKSYFPTLGSGTTLCRGGGVKLLHRHENR
jgi:hypothetical protein